MDGKGVYYCNIERGIAGYFRRKLEDRLVGLTLSFEIAPIIAGASPQMRPWWTNAYTAGWNALVPLYLAGVMAFIGSSIGSALAILNKLPTVEIKMGLHGYNQVLVMISLTLFLPLTWQTFLMYLLP